MTQNKPNPNGIPILLAELSLPKPASIDEAIAVAKAHYLRWDAYRRLQLFVFCAFLGANPYLYPVIAADEDSAYYCAWANHEARELPPPDRWVLI